MNAIREIVKPVNRKIIIELPGGFSEEDEYEVIILNLNEKQQNIKNNTAKDKFFSLAGNIDIDEKAVNKLRDDSVL